MSNILNIIGENEIYRKELDKVMEEERQRIEKQGENDKDKNHQMDTSEFRLIEEYNQKVNLI